MIAAALVSLVAALQPGKMPKLDYFHGRVLQNVHVVPVLWGPNVDSATVSGIAGFYAAATRSLSWLDVEYGAPVGKSIQNGDAEQARQIMPAPSLLPGANGPPVTVSEAAIVSELRLHIGPGKELQQPSDPANTVYMVHFPKFLQITAGNAVSCQAGGFCALHDTFAPLTGTSSNLLVALVPDHSAGSGCETGCGISTVPFQNVTNSASHELVETVTDPDVGVSQNFSDRLVGWYDTQDPDVEWGHAEIADICANGGADAASLDSTYVVQKEWSNAYRACIGTPDDAFSIDTAATPATLKIPNAGVPVPLAVKTTARAGPNPLAGPNVTFSVPIPPDKVTVQNATTTVNTLSAVTVTAAQGASLPATMIVHADSEPGHAAQGQPQTTAFALVTLTADDFTLAGPQGTAVSAGQQVTLKVQTATATGSDPATIALSLTGPDGVTGSLDTAQITSGGSAVATVHVDAGVRSGGAPVTVNATTGLVTHSLPLLLVVDGDDFSMSLDKSQDSVVRGGAVSVVVKTFTTHGSPQPLTLSAQLPEGVAASFNPPQIQSGQTSTVTLNTGGAKSFGTQPVTIVAQGPHTGQQAPFSLGVGQSQSGCSSANGAPAFAALALLILRRRR